ncbi:Transposase (plasmid) [Mycetohabitans rhizoxinica HKI 454]|uniref:Transposase n=1 Tax=Mycetohabitans rhizoxinica (strain DSM 19002 / CIP 109453 / HKI 454) TaxID=882378 RepID=E5AW74_MYCRK|nr:Transposase [Mycetohabitans rhizoxinica HKI 454]
MTPVYHPQTKGKAERFHQSALREWADAWTYQSCAHRREVLTSWQHHYNWHRAHSAIGGIAPMARLSESRNYLLTHHTPSRPVVLRAGSMIFEDVTGIGSIGNAARG